MATKNAIDNKSGDLTIDPGASGDSFIQFDINGTGEFRIGVDDTDDSFRISQGSALGTNDTFIMTGAGELTMPLQPAFLAHVTTADSNVTGDGTIFTLGSGNALTAIFDQGGDFNTNGTFTAPVTGRYFLHASFFMSGVTAGFTDSNMKITTSNGTYYSVFSHAGNCAASNDQLIYSGATFCDMDASDTATALVTVAGGAKTIDIRNTNRDTRIEGFLVS